jgi:hypothetical protein
LCTICLYTNFLLLSASSVIPTMPPEFGYVAVPKVMFDFVMYLTTNSGHCKGTYCKDEIFFIDVINNYLSFLSALNFFYKLHEVLDEVSKMIIKIRLSLGFSMYTV